MDLEISGLKCDFCDYRDDDVKFFEYKDSIGKKCPKCGSNLLTEKEYNDCLLMYKKVEQIKKIFNVLKWLNPMQYYRLIFGDKRKTYVLSKKFENKHNKQILNN